MEQESSMRRVVVVGGGIAGVASFIAAIRFRAAARIDVVDPRGIGRGIAFYTSEPALLCNTSVETMSLLDDDPDDFLRYLHEQGVEGAERNSFVSRHFVSHYTEARYMQYCALAESQGIEHRYIKANVLSISKRRNGTYCIELDDGAAIDASDVLICTGNGAAFQPETVRSLLGNPGIHGSLYPGAYP